MHYSSVGMLVFAEVMHVWRQGTHRNSVICPHFKKKSKISHGLDKHNQLALEVNYLTTFIFSKSLKKS